MLGMSKSLTELRSKINQVDQELVRLLSERAGLAKAIGEVKAASGTEVYDPSREGEVIKRWAEANSAAGSPLSKGAIEEIASTIIGACRRLQIPS